MKVVLFSGIENKKSRKSSDLRLFKNTGGGIWTPTGLLPLRPERSASANSATPACQCQYITSAFSKNKSNQKIFFHGEKKKSAFRFGIQPWICWYSTCMQSFTCELPEIFTIAQDGSSVKWTAGEAVSDGTGRSAVGTETTACFVSIHRGRITMVKNIMATIAAMARRRRCLPRWKKIAQINATISGRSSSGA